jgi:hypothetical protein
MIADGHHALVVAIILIAVGVFAFGALTVRYGVDSRPDESQPHRRNL